MQLSSRAESEEGMERLIEIKTHVAGFCYADKKEGVFVQDVFDKLAAYEDTGLMPEQIQAQQQEIEQLKDRNVTYVNENANQAKEIERLNEVLDDWKHEAECDFDYIATLIADKDEQAGRIMRMDNGLKKLRRSLQWLKETIHDRDYKAWAEDNIGKIDALLEDEKVFSFAHCAYEFRPATCKGIGVNCDTCGRGKLIERVSEDRGGAKDGK